ncbi:MAG: Crp/Fnr family transcriptional regulator [Rhizobiaceae bacterium]|nr:Crp/Fnr family transcriptional regulator [Rhizobiaceae bacterium]MCV0406966.1 Crp/Fnr family transcriptional regulator [Rhizobiaceae bacterium]
MRARQDLISEGDRPEHVHLVMEGLACRYKILPSGRRSIVALLIPGDFCDLNVAILGEMDHAIATMSDSRIVQIPRSTIDELIKTHPNITRAFWWATLVDEGTLREWLANMGRRPSDKQMAHFFCEMFARMAAVGRARKGRFFLPLTQEDLGDVLGMSTVHVNRTMQRLREMELLDFSDHEVLIRKPDRLIEFAEFDPNYLHLGFREDA